MLSANEIRKQFIEFFTEKHQHTFVPSASVVPLDDPTLYFTNAGMNQFKDVFLGTGTRPYNRAVNSQKCIRVSGKHNDLEEVGRDTYHHTFFEMLGNWSFGDYYKEEAIQWAWELLTEVWGIDKTRLHATVFGGDKDLDLGPDEEAASLWKKVTDINPDHIHYCSKKDNFWMMGATGPCGPCSEIHIDLTPDGSGKKLVNADDPRVMEIWNLVFIQYNCNEDGSLTQLPATHIDTGMGFERLVAVMQNKKSNYDTDVFSPILNAISELTGKKYTGDLENLQDIAFRVVADHLRMVSFSIADGALPDSQKEGFVIRSVLRRAVRFLYQIFEQREPLMYKLVPALVDHMGDAFPELREKQQRITEVIQDEETSFLKTIERGLKLFQDAAERAKDNQNVVSGEDAFKLHSTYGFPIDLTVQMAQENKLTVDMDEFNQHKNEHETSGGTSKPGGQIAIDSETALPLTDDSPRWSTDSSQGTVLGWIEKNEFNRTGMLTVDHDADDEIGLILDKTCFYAESGGQVGDQGTITTSTGVFAVENTIKLGESVLHVGKITKGEIKVGDDAELAVDNEREFTKKNHTATHLLHWALQKVLGDHVEQRGSKVKPTEFSFDFKHDKPLSLEQKQQVEQMVNEKIYRDEPVEWKVLAADEAKKLPGVRAFFGDKYGDEVRVVSIGDGYSTEFCGGTHLDTTGQAGCFKITGEELVSKGVRRIIGCTARGAVEQIQQLDSIVSDLTNKLSCPPAELGTRIESLQQEIKKLNQQLKKSKNTDLQGAADQLLASANEIDGAKIIVGEMPPADIEVLRSQSDRLKKKAGTAAIFLAWVDEDKVQLLASVTDDLTKRGVHAGNIIKEVAQIVGGRGGGRPNMAQAGGKDTAKVGDALKLAKELIEKQLAK